LITEDWLQVEAADAALLPRPKILLVDDREENLIALTATLQSLGEELVLARSGEDALRSLLRADYAVILLDAQMPGMSGFETAGIIRERERNRHTPIIFLTAISRERESVAQGYSMGAADYITKPYDPDILRSKVRVFVELFKRGEEIKRQQEMLRQSALREAERLRREQVWELEQEHMRTLTIELEARVAERTGQLVEANEELEAFCYSISHDLRAPLRAITATSMILLEESEGKLPPDHIEHLLRQAHNSRRLATLIDDLLQLSRIGRKLMETRSVDLSKIARDVADDVLSRGWDNPPKIEVEGEMCVNGDPGLLRLLLENLVDNACKYSPKGGCIRVGSRHEGDDTVYFIKDTGIGFDMKYEHKIFLPFERLVLETEFPGTGIGLANAQRVVKRHGGKIWAKSQLGKGTTFFFTIGDIKVEDSLGESVAQVS
jgi:two-component system sensor histidine kinase/response regulator